MRLFSSIICLFMSPHLFQESSLFTSLLSNELIFFGTDVTIHLGVGVESEGHFISFVDSSNKLYFVCVDTTACRYAFGSGDKPLKIQMYDGSLKTHDIPSLDVYLRYASAVMNETRTLNLISFTSPVVIKPENGSVMNISQQNEDLSLILPSTHWDITVDSGIQYKQPDYGLSQQKQDLGRAQVQLSNGELTITETLVSVNTY